MKPIPIHVARDFAKKVGARGVVVLVFSGPPSRLFGWTSYGASREDCGKMERFAEKLLRPVEEGELNPWE